MQSYKHHRDAHPITYPLDQASALTLGSSGTTGSLGEQPPRGAGGLENSGGSCGEASESLSWVAWSGPQAGAGTALCLVGLLAAGWAHAASLQGAVALLGSALPWPVKDPTRTMIGAGSRAQRGAQSQGLSVPPAGGHPWSASGIQAGCKGSSSMVTPPTSSPLPPGDPLPHPGGFGHVLMLCLLPWFAPSPEQEGPTRLHLQAIFCPCARQHLAHKAKGFPLSPFHPQCVLSSQFSVRMPGSLASACHIAEVSVTVVSLQELVCEAQGT